MRAIRRLWTCLLLTLLLVAGPLAWTGAARPGPADADLVAARVLFFGAENVDERTGMVRPDRFLLSWVGVATYVAAIRGHVVLLDAYIPDMTAAYPIPGVTPEALAAAAPEYVFIGHGHWDHASDAAQVILASGAKLVGTQGHCDQARKHAREVFGASGSEIACIVVPSGIGAMTRLPLPGLQVDAFTHVHSAGEMPDWFHEGDPVRTVEEYLRAPLPGHQSEWGCVPVTPVEPTLLRPPSVQDGILARYHAAVYGVMHGVVLYRFTVGEFSLVFQDSSGNLSELTRAQDGRLLREALDESIDGADVLVAAALNAGMHGNCGRDLGYYMDGVEARVYLASHHDYQELPWGHYAKSSRDWVEHEVAKRPGLCLIFPYDPDDDPATPEDFLNWRIMSFEPAAPKWTRPAGCDELTAPLA